jgi:hypothetical protein
MNRTKAIVALTATLMSTAMVSAPASAQTEQSVMFPASACQPTNSDSAARLTFDSNSVRHNGIDNNSATMVCPINNPVIFRKVIVIAKVSFPVGSTPPSCFLRSFQLDGTQLGSSASTKPTSDGKSLVTSPSIIPGNYHTLRCTLRPGSDFKNYRLVTF